MDPLVLALCAFLVGLVAGALTAWGFILVGMRLQYTKALGRAPSVSDKPHHVAYDQDTGQPEEIPVDPATRWSA